MPAKAPPERSGTWRRIRQDCDGSAAASERPGVWGRRLRLVALLAFLGVIGAGLTWAVRTAASSDLREILDPPSLPVREVRFETDGVLGRQWLLRQAGIQTGQPLKAVDIFALKKRLERFGQVREATVQRIFPDALRVSLAERRPVLRVAVAGSDGRPEVLLVAADAQVYRGYGYASRTLRQLPFLEGETIAQSRSGAFLPLEGLHQLIRLVTEARTKHPRLYRDWFSVRLDGLREAGRHPLTFLTVRTRQGGRIVFAPSDFAEQFARLGRILPQARPGGLSAGERLDVSYEAPVLSLAADAPARGGPY